MCGTCAPAGTTCSRTLSRWLTMLTLGANSSATRTCHPALCFDQVGVLNCVACCSLLFVPATSADSSSHLSCIVTATGSLQLMALPPESPFGLAHDAWNAGGGAGAERDALVFGMRS